jgi:DNA-binding response OmpR family regulator
VGCVRCVELEDRIAILEEMLGVNREEIETAVLSKAFGLSQKEAWFLLALWRAAGRVLSLWWLLDNRPKRLSEEDGTETPQNLVRVYIHKLRRKVGHDCVETIKNHGYRLTPAGMARIQKAISIEGQKA